MFVISAAKSLLSRWWVNIRTHFITGISDIGFAGTIVNGWPRTAWNGGTMYATRDVFRACSECGGVFRCTQDWKWWTKDRRGKKKYFCGRECYENFLMRRTHHEK